MSQLHIKMPIENESINLVEAWILAFLGHSGYQTKRSLSWEADKQGLIHNNFEGVIAGLADKAIKDAVDQSIDGMNLEGNISGGASAVDMSYVLLGKIYDFMLAHKNEESLVYLSGEFEIFSSFERFKAAYDILIKDGVFETSDSGNLLSFILQRIQKADNKIMSEYESTLPKLVHSQDD